MADRIETIVAVLRKKDQAYERYQAAMRISSGHAQQAAYAVYEAACIELAEIINGGQQSA